MKIEIWSDVVCPWCAVGKRRFEKALLQFDHASAVDVEFRSFELDPSAPQRREGSQDEYLAAKYRIPTSQAAEMHQQMTQVAAAEGLDFRFDIAKSGNTFDAHQLLHHAKANGVQAEMKDRLLLAYFTQGLPISDRATLVQLAEEIGLDGAAEVLEADAYADAVRADEAEASALGISGVPFFVVDRKYGVSGAQPPEALLQVLDRAWSDAEAA